MLPAPFSELEKKPEVLTTVLHIVLNLCGDLDDYDGLCNRADYHSSSGRMSMNAIPTTGRNSHLSSKHLDQVCQDCCHWAASTAPVLRLMIKIMIIMVMMTLMMMMTMMISMTGNLSSKSSLKQMGKALANVPWPPLKQVRLDVSQTVTGVLNVIKMSRQCLFLPGEESDQPMSRSRTLLDDLPDDGHPVRHHTALPLPDVVEDVEKKACFTSDCHPFLQNVRQSHISHPMSPDVVVCVE